METVALCNFEPARLLFFSSNVPQFVYYSHVPALLAALFLSVLVFFRRGRHLSNRIFFWSLVPFTIWVFLNLIIWASNRSDLIMFLWSIQIMVEPITYAGMLYLLYVFAEGRDVSFRLKLFVIGLFLPLVAITPTRFLLPGFDLAQCIPIESYYSFYSYVLEITFVIWIVFYAFWAYRHVSEPRRRGEILFLAIGIILFLLSFASGNIIGSLTGDWNLAQVGLLGMPLFAGFVGYAIVRFQAFNIKIVAAQALVIALFFLLLSALLVRSESNIRIVIIATLIAFAIFGYQLVRSVRQEVEQREEIESLADRLKRANARLTELDRQKSEFVSIASHQLRSPLTAIKGYASLMLEGSFGNMSPAAREAAQKIFDSSQLMVLSVEDFLNVSRIEQGKLKYDFSHLDLNRLLSQIVEELRPIAEKKNLSFEYSKESDKPCVVWGDEGKLVQVFRNLIDNSIKYTDAGYIRIHLATDQSREHAVVSISDSGIGIAKDELPHLFAKFVRAKSAHAVNISGTGLGLYIAKQFVEAHKGKIWVESNGVGEGTTFFVDLPIK